MSSKNLWLAVGLILIFSLVGSYFFFAGKDLPDGCKTFEGNFVVMLLDANNIPTKYWVIQNDTIDQENGMVSFDEQDGETIHLHANVIFKEFEDANQLNSIKKEYVLK